ncbi:MAG: methyltransferase [Desulfobacterales bacterium]|nr:MAG: methyltransferase [Desulfobacterales bacterium]
MNNLTTDTFFEGRLRVSQSSSGYRFSIDAVLLAYHVRLRPGDKVLDLGTGCAIIPLILAYRNPEIAVFGIEIQAGLADVAALNVRNNAMGDRITILRQDIAALKPEMIAGPADVVVCNPPYRKPESGRINPDQERAVARHEIRVSLSDVIQTVRRVLRTAGRFITIYPAERITDLLTHMRSAQLEPKFLRIIYSGRHAAAKLILVEAIKGARPGARIGAPLIIYDEGGEYTAEVKQMLRP